MSDHNKGTYMTDNNEPQEKIQEEYERNEGNPGFSFTVGIPCLLLSDPNLSDRQFRLMINLIGLAREHGYCWCSDQYLADKMDISLSQIKREVRSLEKKEYIIRKTVKEGMKSKRSIYVAPAFSKKPYEGSHVTPSEGHTRPSRRVTGELPISKANKILNKRKSPNLKSSDDPPPFSSDVEKLCEHLRSRVLGHGIKIKDPKESKTTWNNWIREMEKLLRIDGKSYEEVKKIIDYSHDDPFWCKNILSASKLRKQYDRLLFQWKDPKKRIINNKSTTYALRKELKKDKDYFIVMENYCKDSRKDLVIFFDQESKDFCLKLKKLFPWASFEVNNEFI